MTTQTNDKLRAGMDLIKAVKTLYDEKGIPEETVFNAIERAVRLAVGKFFGDDEDVDVTIDRRQGLIAARKGEKVIDVASGELGRISAQAAKQQMIQLFREEESNSALGDLSKQKGQLLSQPGIIQRVEGGAAIVSIGKHEAILPRGEMIPGETPHPGEKIRALVKDVRKSGHRIKIVLSRADELFVQRMFEQKVPEIEDKTIKIERVAREAGYRTKVAVSSIDQRVDCVGACVGVRGSRIKEITEELGGSERIDIVRWNASEEQLIRNSLQPADIEEVFLYDLLRRAIVLVREDQLSLAIGKRGQNVRLASKLVDWDIEIMTGDELNNAITGAEEKFMALNGATPEAVNKLIENGCLSYEDVEPLTTNEVMAICEVDEETADELIIQAAEMVEEAAKQPKQGKREGIRQQASAAPSHKQKFDNLFKDGPAAPPAPVETAAETEDLAPLAAALLRGETVETEAPAGVSEGEALSEAPAEAPAEPAAPSEEPKP